MTKRKSSSADNRAKLLAALTAVQADEGFATKRSMQPRPRGLYEDHQRAMFYKHGGLIEPFPELHPTAEEVAKEYNIRNVRLADPTTADHH